MFQCHSHKKCYAYYHITLVEAIREAVIRSGSGSGSYFTTLAQVNGQRRQCVVIQGEEYNPAF